MQSLFDTHAHLNDRQFKNDAEGAVSRASAEGVSRIVCPGYDLPSSRRAVDLARRFDGVWAAVGVHPHDAKLLDDAALAELARLAAEPKVVAIGEIGLDFYRDLSPRPVQEEAFRLQLRLAKELDLPVIVHDRDAQEDVLRIIEDEGPPLAGGVMHCFSGDLEQARRAFEMEFYIGAAGPVTYGKSHRLREVVKTVRAERLLIETDSPYLTPEPFRGRRKNEPAFVRLVAEKLAEVRRMSLDDVAQVTTENALRLFQRIRQ
jgi:TatD DNase family protein